MGRGVVSIIGQAPGVILLPACCARDRIRNPLAEDVSAPTFFRLPVEERPSRTSLRGTRAV